MTALKNVLFAQVVTFRLAPMLDVDNYRNHDNFACDNCYMQYT